MSNMKNKPTTIMYNIENIICNSVTLRITKVKKDDFKRYTQHLLIYKVLDCFLNKFDLKLQRVHILKKI